MAARITELVNATLRTEVDPGTQLTEAQVPGRDSSAAPRWCCPLRTLCQEDTISCGTGMHHGIRCVTSPGLPVCRCWT